MIAAEETNEPLSITMVILFLFAILAISSVIRWFTSRNIAPETARKRMSSLRTWWILAALLSFGMLGGHVGVCLLMAIVSCIAFVEFDTIICNEPVTLMSFFAEQRPVFILLILANYWLIVDQQTELYFRFIPIAGGITTAVICILKGRTDGYIRETAGRFWGLMTLVYFLSFSVLITDTAASKVWGEQGKTFFFLIVLTQVNDIAQALVGRRFGWNKSRQLAPKLSPNKTWEGALGGFAVTVLASILLAPVFTGLADAETTNVRGFFAIPLVSAGVAGALISVAGVFGDLNMSGLKRDAKIKDSSRLLPGMGGLIDRIDSLTFTAPVFYLYLNMITV